MQDLNCNDIRVSNRCILYFICRISSGTVLIATPAPSVNTGMHVAHKK